MAPILDIDQAARIPWQTGNPLFVQLFRNFPLFLFSHGRDGYYKS